MAKDPVVELFRELVGDRALNLDGGRFPADANTRITRALLAEHEGLSDDQKVEIDSIGLNLVDWQREAAFITALVMFPDRFTDEQIQEEVRGLVFHVPDHVNEALAAFNKLDEL